MLWHLMLVALASGKPVYQSVDVLVDICAEHWVSGRKLFRFIDDRRDISATHQFADILNLRIQYFGTKISPKPNTEQAPKEDVTKEDVTRGEATKEGAPVPPFRTGKAANPALVTSIFRTVNIDMEERGESMSILKAELASLRRSLDGIMYCPCPDGGLCGEAEDRFRLDPLVALEKLYASLMDEKKSGKDVERVIILIHNRINPLSIKGRLKDEILTENFRWTKWYLKVGFYHIVNPPEPDEVASEESSPTVPETTSTSTLKIRVTKEAQPIFAEKLVDWIPPETTAPVEETAPDLSRAEVEELGDRVIRTSNRVVKVDVSRKRKAPSHRIWLSTSAPVVRTRRKVHEHGNIALGGALIGCLVCVLVAGPLLYTRSRGRELSADFASQSLT